MPPGYSEALLTNKMTTPKFTPGYEVTPDGRIYSVTSNWRGHGRREMNHSPNSDGYPSVRIMINGKRKRIAVHVLVARHHLPGRPSVMHEIRHLDGNKLNPHASNLAWGTDKENTDDREKHGRTSRGPSHGEKIREGWNRRRAALARARGLKGGA